MRKQIENGICVFFFAERAFHSCSETGQISMRVSSAQLSPGSC